VILAVTAVVLAISPRTAFVDAPPQVTVRGLAPNTVTTVRASTKDVTGTSFGAQMRVRADRSGVARVPMSALLSSLRPPRGEEYADTFPWGGQVVTLSAAGKTARFRLLVRAKNVKAAHVRKGLYGEYYASPSPTPRPAVVLFGGSEGGLYSVAQQGILLASRGIPTLALAYFGAPGRPKELRRIPLEYFAKAVRWLGRQPGVDPKRISLVGGSRGAEAALLVADAFPSLVHAVVGVAGSDRVMCSHPRCDDAAWTLKRRGVGPDIPIPTQHFRKRVLLICGGADLLIPACPMAESIKARRKRASTRILAYPDAAHGITVLTPNVPYRFPPLEGHGRLANARARVDAWPKLLAFLRG
jgi:dienelactone hydrolase